MRIALNNGWEFTEKFSQPFLDMEPAEDAIQVRLPHTCRQTPFDYFDEGIYQMLCGYRRKLEIPEIWEGKRLFLNVGAAGHFAEVFFNGEKLAEHRCGYTAFRVELTEHAHFGSENTLVIRLDTKETLNQPPFGFVVDYMTYGGLYREVFLEVKETACISDVFLKPDLNIESGEGILRGVVTLDGAGGNDYALRQSITDCSSGAILARGSTRLRSGSVHTRLRAGEVKAWSTVHPHLYLVTTELMKDRKILDRVETRVGFRKAEFRKDGFYLNGEKLRLRGLNRHQSWSYVGYAMPESMQRMDADILKKELGLNAVRTSHYPQSQHFIDRCDELGLLVFTEIPGWQHIGDEDWKAQAVENVREMVQQYRNHPSIVLWGVRINESSDDDALYTETNRVCRELDPTRPTSGVRCIKNSSLLEDVYAYNDFLHDGTNAGCDSKKSVTSDMEKPYLISEYNGHMFPTKMYDSEYHFLEHALRHARVLDAVAGETDIAGSFGWCMFDYNTHKDFGSGDRICYHGVMDMFRNPKLAAAVYASQADEAPVLELSSQMDIGEHPSGNMGKVFLFTNADSVRMYRNDRLIREYRAAESPFTNLAHGPILLDDYIGDRLREEQGYSASKARLVKDILNYSAIYGFSDLPVHIKTKAARAMTQYRMTMEDAYRLYGIYIGGWGDGVTSFRFEAVKDGHVVKTVEKAPVTEVRLQTEISHTTLREGDTYDVASIRIRAVDGRGNLLRFYHGPVRARVQGPVEIIGPETVTLRGGCGGTYLRTTGETGQATLTLESDQLGHSTHLFEIIKEE